MAVSIPSRMGWPRVRKWAISEEEMDEAVFHMEVQFSGRVQGIGFRYHTLHIAKEYEVSGYVTNLTDGRVKVEAEGLESEVRAFKKEIETQMETFIRQVEIKTQNRPRSFSGFTIR